MEKENWLCIAFNSTDPERGVGRNIFIRLINLHYIGQTNLLFERFWDNRSFLSDKRCLCIAVAWLVVVSTAAARDLDTKSPGNIWGGGGSVLRMMILMIRIITIRIIMIGMAFMSMVYQVNIGRRMIMVAHFLDDNNQD